MKIKLSNNMLNFGIRHETTFYFSEHKKVEEKHENERLKSKKDSSFETKHTLVIFELSYSYLFGHL